MMAFQFYPASERFYECVNCQEAIFNPICPVCLTTQLEAWLSSISSYPLKKKLIEKIKKYVERTDNLAGETTKCIACGNPRASLCPYCFTNYVFNVLKEMNVSREIIKEFLQFFNYDFEHTGYSKEAEKLGVI